MVMEQRPYSEHLHYAIANGDVNKVQELLTKGVNVNSKLYLDEDILQTANRLSLNSLRQSSHSLKQFRKDSASTIHSIPTVEEDTQTEKMLETTVDEEIKDTTENNRVNTKHVVTQRRLDYQHTQPKNLDELLSDLEDIKNETVPANRFISTIPKINIAETKPIEKEVEETDPDNKPIENEPVNPNENTESQLNTSNIDFTNNDEKNSHMVPDVNSEIINTIDPTVVNLNPSSKCQSSNSNLNDNKLNISSECFYQGKEETKTHHKSVSNLVDEKLNDNNECLIERRNTLDKPFETPNPSSISKIEKTDENQNKIKPRLRKKLSFKRFSRKVTKKDIPPVAEYYDEEDSCINYGPTKVQNVDDEQLNENFAGIAFFEAVQQGMGMIVQTLLETSNNHQLNLPDEDGFTPVMQAAWHGSDDIIQILLDHGADTALTNATGCTAIHFAAGQGHTKCIEILAQDQLVDINCQTKFGATPLILAAKCGYKDSLDILLKYGANPNIQYRGKQNALLFAAGNGHYECIQSLIKHNVDVNQANAQFVTPLMRATQQGHNDCVMLLTDNEAKLDLQDIYGRTAAHFAVEYNNYKALQILLDAGINIDLTTKGGNTVMDYAERYHNHKCEDLIENQINIRHEKSELSKNKNFCLSKDDNTVTCMKLRYIFRRRKNIQ